MPALFIGHGHPMNALMDNQFTQRLQLLLRPSMILEDSPILSSGSRAAGTGISHTDRSQLGARPWRLGSPQVSLSQSRCSSFPIKY